MNSLNIAGHIGQDAETRATKSGTIVTTFSVPVEQGWGDNKTTTWVKCVMFGKKGSGSPHGLTPYLTKGKFAAVTGEMSLDQWEHQGKGYAQVKLIVRDVSLGGGGEQKTTQQQAPAQQAAYDNFEDSIPF